MVGLGVGIDYALERWRRRGGLWFSPAASSSDRGLDDRFGAGLPTGRGTDRAGRHRPGGDDRPSGRHPSRRRCDVLRRRRRAHRSHAVAVRGEAAVARGREPLLRLLDPNGGASELIGILAAAAILFLAFGSLVAAALPIGMAVFGLTIGVATMTVLGKPGQSGSISHGASIAGNRGRAGSWPHGARCGRRTPVAASSVRSVVRRVDVSGMRRVMTVGSQSSCQ
ncbi:MMPL family transporter [Streptomyces sp. NPDC058646]|uniref:MMPL family transporter n=1 Tax=Streptomyces sp. NPDC058646 TaxID=3346574 RepID=UPI00365655D6